MIGITLAVILDDHNKVRGKPCPYMRMTI